MDEFAPFAAEAKRLFASIRDTWGVAWIMAMEFHAAQPNAQDFPIEESVNLMRSIGAKFGLGLALNMAARKAYCQLDYETGRIYGEEATSIFRAMGEKWTLANGLFLLGEVLIAQNQYERLAEIYAEGLLKAQQSGSRTLEAQFRRRQEWLSQQASL